MPCHAIPCHAIPCHTMPFCTMPYHAISPRDAMQRQSLQFGSNVVLVCFPLNLSAIVVLRSCPYVLWHGVASLHSAVMFVVSRGIHLLSGMWHFASEATVSTEGVWTPSLCCRCSRRAGEDCVEVAGAVSRRRTPAGGGGEHSRSRPPR